MDYVFMSSYFILNVILVFYVVDYWSDLRMEKKHKRSDEESFIKMKQRLEKMDLIIINCTLKFTDPNKLKVTHIKNNVTSIKNNVIPIKTKED